VRSADDWQKLVWPPAAAGFAIRTSGVIASLEGTGCAIVEVDTILTAG
jgi:hypothetical protein